jgi:heme-degrading monooxygenase HmoA
VLIRLLTMRVRPERLDDWMRYTREIGFPGMLAQPGCREIRRLHRQGAAHEYQVMTVWDSLADLDRFKASQAMKDLSASAAGLTIPPYDEALYDVIEG